MKKLLKTLVVFSLLAMFIVGLTACGRTGASYNEINDSDFYSVYVAYAESGGTLSYQDWLATIKGEKGDAGVGIASIEKTGTEGLVDTYRIAFTDGSTKEYTITNGAKGDQGEKGDKGDTGAQGVQGDKGADGNGIVSIEKTGTEGLVDTYTVTFTDGTMTIFTVSNGQQGIQGEQGIQGAQGIQGEKGDKGDTGAQGIQGNKGEKGDTGAQGAQGIQGETGNGIISMEKTSSTCYKDIYTVTFSDNTTTTIEVDNNGSGHIYGEWVNGIEATCQANGIKYRVCSICEKKEIEIAEIEENRHYFIDDQCIYIAEKQKG